MYSLRYRQLAQMMRWILLAVLSGAAFASQTVYVDFSCSASGGNTCNGGTQTNPYSTWTQVWSAINSARNTGGSALPITIFISATTPGTTAPKISSSQIDISQCTNGSPSASTGCYNPANNMSDVVFDGISMRNSGTATVPVWSSNLGSRTLAPCSDFDLEGPSPPAATCTYNIVPKFTIQASIPITGPANSNDFANCIYGFTVQGFAFQGNDSEGNNTAGQSAELSYIGSLLFQYNEVTRLTHGSNGPGIYAGPGQHGPCHPGTGANARPNGTDSGPDNVTIQYNFVHATWGECIYLGASTSDPWTFPCTGNNCQQYEGGINGTNLACGNGCSSNSGNQSPLTGICSSSGAKASSCSTGANYIVQGNTIESCAAWGAQGDGTDVKDGHTNLQVLDNIYHTTKTPACATNGSCSGSFCQHNGISTGQSCSVNADCNCDNLVCWGGSNAGNVCTVANSSSVCGSGANIYCGAGADGQGPLFESGSLVSGNYVEAPGHQGTPVYASWNNTVGRGDMKLLNNIYVNINSNIGSNNAFEVWTPTIVAANSIFAHWSSIEGYNNAVYDGAGDCFGNQTGSGATGTIQNNVCWLAGGITGTWTRDYNDIASNTETHGISSNPNFVSTTLPASSPNNFNLQAGSPAIGAGNNLSGTFTTDYSGNTRTPPWWMGAFGSSGGGGVSAPTLSLAAGTYLNAQSTTLTSSTSGTTIIYTVDGTTPATSSGTCTPAGTSASGTNGFSLSIALSETVKALACLSGTNSTVTSAQYFIQYTQTVVVNQTGAVVSIPAGIACTNLTSPCAANFDSLATITYTASPTSIFYIFGGWFGACTGSSCSVSGSSAQSVTAAFALNYPGAYTGLTNIQFPVPTPNLGGLVGAGSVWNQPAPLGFPVCRLTDANWDPSKTNNNSWITNSSGNVGRNIFSAPFTAGSSISQRLMMLSGEGSGLFVAFYTPTPCTALTHAYPSGSFSSHGGWYNVTGDSGGWSYNYTSTPFLLYLLNGDTSIPTITSYDFTSAIPVINGVSNPSFNPAGSPTQSTVFSFRAGSTGSWGTTSSNCLSSTYNMLWAAWGEIPESPPDSMFAFASSNITAVPSGTNTINVANGSTAFTIASGPALATDGSLVPAIIYIPATDIPGNQYNIASVTTGGTAGTLTTPWTGTSGTFSMNIPGGQDSGFDIAFYIPGKGCGHVNTGTGVVTADSAIGGSGTLSISDRFTLHGIRMTPDGKRITMSTNHCVAGTSCQSGIPGYQYIVGTNTMSLYCPAGSQCSGHSALGYNNLINNGGGGAESFMQLQERAYTNPTVYSNVLAGLPWSTCSYSDTGFYDSHYSWNSDDLFDVNPIAGTSTTTSTGAVPPGSTTCPTINELDAISPVTGGLFRFALTGATGLNFLFNAENALGAMSTDGGSFVFSSDWQTTLGCETNSSSSCTPSSSRSDLMSVYLLGTSTPGIIFSNIKLQNLKAQP